MANCRVRQGIIIYDTVITLPIASYAGWYYRACIPQIETNFEITHLSPERA